MGLHADILLDAAKPRSANPAVIQWLKTVQATLSAGEVVESNSQISQLGPGDEESKASFEDL